MSNVKSKQTNETSMSKILIIFLLQFHLYSCLNQVNGIFGLLLNGYSISIQNIAMKMYEMFWGGFCTQGWSWTLSVILRKKTTLIEFLNIFGILNYWTKFPLWQNEIHIITLVGSDIEKFCVWPQTITIFIHD